MKKAIFKTNINCGGCVDTITPFMERAKTVDSWAVDTDSKHKLLTVKGADLNKQEVVDLVQSAGFEVKEKKGFLSF